MLRSRRLPPLLYPGDRMVRTRRLRGDPHPAGSSESSSRTAPRCPQKVARILRHLRALRFRQIPKSLGGMHSWTHALRLSRTTQPGRHHRSPGGTSRPDRGVRPPSRRFFGTIWGGNLAVIASLAGTPWLPKLQSEEAFFFEDIDEAPYRIDRYLTQLSQAGFFDHCRQVFLGTFTQFHPESAVL
ncbi:MAG TPA: hypothetical protein EYO33_18000, partial [Phycisphaerales bacterium]|nr:hypothetical protein [Phycisphaerales bacterium]